MIRNPFLQNFKLRVIEISKKTRKIDTKDIQSGVILKYSDSVDVFCVEQQQNVSVYKVPFMNNVLFGELKGAGRNMLLYIMYNIKPDQDTINLKIEPVGKAMGITRPSVISGISQLKDIGVICSKSQSEYWINPFYVFNGNRINYYNEHCPECIEIVARHSK